jgi:hypothetical protein
MEMPADLDLSIKVVELVGFLGSAALILFRMGRITERFEMIGKHQAAEITELKLGVEKLSLLMTEVALQKQRLDTMDRRQETLDKRYEDLRRGVGKIE